MKQAILALSTILLSTIATFAQVRVGVTAGAQLANVITRDLAGSRRGDDKAGLLGGLVLDVPLSDKLSLRPQLLYSMKGTMDSFGGTESSATVNYIEAPVQLLYGIKAGSNKVLLGAGPYVGYALNGTLSVKYAGQTQNGDIKFGSDSDQLKRLDIGLRLSAGYELKAGLSLSVFFAPGFNSIANDSDTAARNRAFGVSLGYLFGGR